jgi:hypothetical protein
MSMAVGLFVQHVTVALAVMVSAAFVVQQQWPGAMRRLRTNVALWLLRDERSMRLKRLGRSIAPAPRTNGAGCGSCNGCDPTV